MKFISIYKVTAARDKSFSKRPLAPSPPAPCSLLSAMSSVNTPPAAGSPATPSPDKPMTDAPSKAELDKSIGEYLRARGYDGVAAAFESSLKDDKGKKPVVDTEALRKALEPRLKESASVLSELTAMASPANLQSLLLNLGTGVDDILSLDPTDRHEGFRELESWVEGSLDMYRVCGTPPIIADLAHAPTSPNFGQYCSQSSAISTWISFSAALKTLVRRNPRPRH